MHILRQRSPHAGQLERWLSPEITASIAKASMEVHRPIYVANVPGGIRVYHGDFIGPLKAGGYATLLDHYIDRLGRAWKRAVVRPGQLNAGFTSLSDLISEATSGGKRQQVLWNKAGPTGVANVASSLWRLGTVPAAGAMGAALSGGTLCDRTTTGAIGPQVNAAGGDTLHLLTHSSEATVAANTLVLYDRIWHGAPTMNSTGAQTISYTPGRYATTACPGTVMWMEVGGTALAATAHNHTVEYTDDAGNTAQSTGAVAGVASAIVDRFDLASGTWTIPLLAGDVGIQTITKYTCSALVATGVMNLVHAYPLSFIPQPVANTAVIMDGINSAFNMVRIQDGACLALCEINKPSASATTYFGNAILCSG